MFMVMGKRRKRKGGWGQEKENMNKEEEKAYGNNSLKGPVQLVDVVKDVLEALPGVS